MSNIWKLILLGVAGLALAGAAIGIVAAQDNGTATPSATDATPADIPADRQAAIDGYLAKLAENLGVTVDDLTGALKQTALDIVDEKVADGTLTEDEAAQIRERIESGKGLFFPPFGRGFHHGMDVGIGVKLDDLAEFLGVDVVDIRDGLQSGQTLAQIAEANGKTADELAAHLLSNLEEKLNEAVANNRITQDRADEILANAPDKIDELINHAGPLGPGRGPHRGFDGGFPFGDDMPVPPSDGSGVTPETSGITF